jgi:hypothetical protein
VDDSDREALCNAILGYLQEHPNAMDTLTGIVDWWLPHHPVHMLTERVAQALERLEARGLIERVGNESRPLFRLRKPDNQ